MAGNVAPHIITDGLVLCLDAANPKSIISGNTTWNDLTTNFYNGTLSTGATYNTDNNINSLTFNGTTGEVNLGNILDYTSGDFTFSTWISVLSLTTNVVNQGPILFFKGTFQVNGYYIQINTNTVSVNFITNQSGARQESVSTSNLFTLSEWFNLIITRSGSSVKIYKNAVNRTLISATHINPTSSSSNFKLAAYQSSIYSNMKIANFMNYNRLLSDDEILQNYNATKGRFGL